VSGHTMQFADTSSGTPTSWLWDFGDGMTSTQQNPSHAYAAAGPYSVKLTVSNAGGSNQTVKVINVP
jgi:PKD repeat protein